MKSLFATLFFISLIYLAVLLILTLNAEGASIENTIGSLTYHTSNIGNVSERFSNKINSDGRLIYTGLLGLAYIEDESKYQVFVGQNSIADIIYGVSYTYNVFKSDIIEAGPIVGFYQQNDDKFIEKGIQPYSLGHGIVPILGGELSIKVLTFDEKYIKLNTVVTPVIINETLSFGVEL